MIMKARIGGSTLLLLMNVRGRISASSDQVYAFFLLLSKSKPDT